MPEYILNQVILPKSELLKRYVSSFNILNKFENGKSSVTYYAFPQSGTEIVFFNQTELKIEEHKIEFSKNTSKKPLVVFLGKYLTPLKVRYKDHVQKIAIHFTETGVVNFFPNYYLKFGQKTFQSAPLSVLELDAEKLFATDTQKGINYLENYLLSRYSPTGIPQIEKAADIFKANPSLSTEELAKQLLMNKKTFSRQFKKHIGCTTSEFKRITRFKKAARNYFEGEHENLAQLCYDNGYYDASDFYKQIRKTTLLKPKDFFKNIQRVGPRNRIYLFE